ncbi:FtsK/SpoIIIE domain-containing protein [Cellulomonas fimi]|uniref:Cell division protein FtsK/SpoIIIE n=1 Tax=Cellulomonas fimi (strain ATCC 484 / DSM 20113 / JCM 1341 / CCUG 24087 / LMG 16345 / NBRC 15513 / NCIMB 8980 / NCTC 7547 / NRS-133) TaxID=590998 RepID=F4H551_CELFA|nr:FtsK/SpoIIIE domain-containing protein [Cellulomonas fimi]AEE46657.1 cell division protein FtsK/SpoIIIE [Cellulomonas fimi ATCC 484]NNH08599.1 hypothetical protein [Cellulomonas fimi]VEH33794.1 DNA translocase FtsK [Cellulomonas fimi]
MRLHALHPDPARGRGLATTEVDVDAGTSVAELRPHLARITGYRGWCSARARLAVDDVLLDESHPAGQPPLVPGATVRVGRGPEACDRAAVRARLHVAVVAGPDSGALVAVPADGAVDLRDTGAPDPLTDVSVDALAVRAHGRRVQVRSATPGVVVRPGRRAHPPRRRRLPAGRWRRWRPGSDVVVGRTTLALRGTTEEGGGSRSGRGAPGVEHRLDATAVATWVGPLVGTVVLAAVVRQPLLLLVGLVTPLAALAVRVAARRRTPPISAPDAGPPATERVRPATDPADLTAATTRAALASGPEVAGGTPWGPDGSLAVVGPRAQALAVARGILLTELGSHLRGRLAVRTADPGAWAWCVDVAEPAPDGHAGTTRWSEDDAPLVVVADDPAALGELARRRRDGPGRELVLLVLTDADAVPGWCHHMLDVTADAPVLRRAGHDPTPVPLHAVTVHRSRRQLERAHAARALAEGGSGPGAAPPATVHLGDLPAMPAPSPTALRHSWSQPPPGLSVALGRGPGGPPVQVDLVADGPHALVAGTTGSGKSELLATLVLAVAAAYPPERLAVLLVDFKGGTGLGPVAGLPHVVDHVTDLDAARTRRVLVALRAETRRRERLLAAHGATDLTDLDPDDDATPPRLLVVVDELRALADDVPDAVPTLARLAAQGRALGLHLVLATQRPAGVVSADLRANVALRIALRVTDEADSRDVLDVPDAARLDPATPGRALVRRGSAAPQVVQVARPLPGRGASPVRTARPLPGRPRWTPAPPPPASGPPGPGPWVDAARHAAAGRTVRPVPWVPALPGAVRPCDLPAGPGLALALGDLPDEQRRTAVRWEPEHGHLLVLGGPGSGRTTALTTLGVQALAEGTEVHAVGLPPAAVGRLRAADAHGTLGTVADAAEVRRVARLLELLAARTDGARAVLLVDGLPAVLDALGGIARGAGADRLVALWGGTVAARVAVAASADASTASLHHAAAFRDRLVLPVADAATDALAGVPVALAGPRGPAGRAVALRDGTAVLCQVAGPPEPSAPPASAARADVLRVEALPSVVDLAAPRGAGGGAGAPRVQAGVPLGVGGDEAREVVVGLDRGLLVAGPPGSGRSNALAVLASGLRAAGRPVVRLTVDGLASLPSPPGVIDVPPEALAGLDAVVLVDDLDEVERLSPDASDALHDLIRRPSAGACVVAATTSGAAVASFRGPHVALLRHRRLLVLDVHEPASAELVGGAAPWLVDGTTRPTGRGVLVTGRSAVPLQVYRPAGASSAGGRV